jgi:hypothetical protein
LQYTIETRELTRQLGQQSSDVQTRQTRLEAADADEAISRYIDREDAELMSVERPARGHESIAMVRKADSLFLVRVYGD